MRADLRRVMSGFVLLLLSQMLLLMLVVRVGASYAIDARSSPLGVTLVSVVAAASLFGAAALLRTRSLVLNVALWAIAAGSGVLSIVIFFNSFPLSLARLVPSLVSFVVFLLAGAWLARRQEER